MTDNIAYCSCGAPLKDSDASVCPKCLLAAGLEQSTMIRSDNEAETLAPTRQSQLPASNSIAAADPDDGQGIGGYRDLEAVHDWSGGTVYKAYHPGLDRRVLLRVLESSADVSTRKAFSERAEILSQLNHPNTVTTLEAGEDDGVAYVAEEFVDGRPIAGFLPRTWRERWREGFYPGVDIIAAMRAVALGLHAIHETGLAHGRLNPDSVLIDSNGMVRLVGLGEASDAIDDRFAGPLSTAENPVAADIHRLGATFYFLVTGKLPTEVGPTRSGTTRSGTTPSIRPPAGTIVTQQLQRLNPYQVREFDQTRKDTTLTQQLKRLNPGLRRQFAHVVARCLDQKDGGFASAAEVARELEASLKIRVTRAGWRPRVYSMFLEGFCLLLLYTLIYSTFVLDYASSPNERAELITTLVFAVPLVYWVVFESVFGWTPVRRLFGLRLLNHAGERAYWGQRLARAILKCALLGGLSCLPMVLIPLSDRLEFSPWSVPILISLWWLSPLYLMYLPTRWIPSRWTYYDLLAGVTWAEESKVDLDSVTDVRQAVELTSRSAAVDRIDQYDIHETLGRGGMGCVYRAHDRMLGRDVAIKVLAGHLVRDPLLLERFQREARLAAKVSHPNVAKVFGNGIWNETPYIAMEFVEGRNLQEIIVQEGQLSVDAAWRYITQAAEALRAADRGGVVHRDIKPANLMVTTDGQLKVTDFGVSRQTAVDVSVTVAGTIVGTPAYMAPEQAMGKDVDCRCDIYALGMTLYHMIAGRAPFTGENAVEILAQQMGESPPSLLGEVGDLTQAQHDVLLQMIAKKPEDRYRDYDSLLADLHRYAPGVDRLARPIKRFAAEACNWFSFYIFLTFSMTPLWLFGRQLGLTGSTGTKAVAGLLFAFYVTIISVYLIGIARGGATPGKRLLGLRVVSPNGQRVGYRRSALRFIAAFPLFAVCVPAMVFFRVTDWPVAYFRAATIVGLAVQVVVLVISLIMLWRDPQRRTLHDLLAGTIVVRNE